MGNICRSPTAHGVFQHLVNEAGIAKQIFVDSAGTHAYHVGESPDRRAQKTATKRGFDLSKIKARRVDVNDFEEFDYILAMDRDNYRHLEAKCPDKHKPKIQLFLEFAPYYGDTEVPDPYYGGQNGFELVLDMVDAAANGLLAHIQSRDL